MKEIKNAYAELIVLADSFVVYWFADQEHAIPVWEHETTSAADALHYFRMCANGHF